MSPPKRSRPLSLAIALALATPWSAEVRTAELVATEGEGLQIHGPAGNHRFAWAASGVGDVNGDGFSDVVVGDWNSEPDATPFAGGAYVVFGSERSGEIDVTNLGEDGFAIVGVDEGDHTGAGVAGAGDVNGDGLTDLIIGARYADPDNKDAAGVSFVVFGKTDATEVELNNLGGDGFAIAGALPGDYSGYAVSAAGDVNGDGLADIIVGARGADVYDMDHAGVAYVVFGKPDAQNIELDDLGTNGFVIRGERPLANTGNAVSGAGDVNGDGLDDVVVGASWANDYAGRAYVVFGKSDTDPVDLASLGGAGFVIEGAQESDGAGSSVSGAGDVNGDGLADVIVSAPFTSPPGIRDAGETHVIFGKRDSDSVALANLGSGGFTVRGPDDDTRVGDAVAGVGDVNRDGLSDVLIGSWRSDPNGLDRAGTAYLVYGRTQTDRIDVADLDDRGVVFIGANENAHFAYDVSGAGDMNADGVPDLLIAARGADAAYALFPEDTPTLSSTYLGYARNGDAPRMPVGVIGNGTNVSSPDGRVWIDFDDGAEFGAAASLHAVTLDHSRNPFPDAVINAHWEIQSGRNEWSSVELTFRYIESEIDDIDEDRLQVFAAPSSSGPYSPVSTRVDEDKNTLTVRVSSLGWFFVGSDVADRIFRDGFQTSE